MLIIKIIYSDEEVVYLTTNNLSRTVDRLTKVSGYSFTIQPIIEVATRLDAQVYLKQLDLSLDTKEEGKAYEQSQWEQDYKKLHQKHKQLEEQYISLCAKSNVISELTQLKRELIKILTD